MAQQPTMQVWTDAWHEGHADRFKNIYTKSALIFPPNKPSVQGNENILEFMSGGLGKVDVFFEPDSLITSEHLAFEYGVFKDIELSGDKILGQGKYSITWVFENDTWKIQCHTWSMPEK